MAIADGLKLFVSTLDLTTSLIFVFALLLTYALVEWMRQGRLPPGPRGLPFLGYGPFLDDTKSFWQAAQELAKRYKSDVISLNIYGRRVTVFHSYDTAKEAFQKRDDMTDRVKGNFLKCFDPSHEGILASSGATWKEQRRFTLLMLRDFGMGKIAGEQSIQDEALNLCQHFKDLGGKSVDPLILLEPAVSNVICALAFGKRFPYDDKEFNASLNALNFLITNFASHYSRFKLSGLLNWLTPVFFGKLDNEMQRQHCILSDFIRKIIKEHREKHDGSVNDLIDGFIAEQDKRQDHLQSFTDEQLRHLIFDLFLAGSETTTSTLRWALLYLVKYPELQERIHAEIASVIGKERAPNMGDKKCTPFTEAFLLELQRYNTIVPTSVAHSCSKDVEFMGYTIPAKSVLLPNLAAIHRDGRVFDEPDIFKPERFMDGDKVINGDKVNQFGIGRRACAGEALARMEIYIFFTTLILHLKFLPSEEKISFSASRGAIQAPKPYKICVTPRQSK